jgi:hypothetical protein
MFLNNERIGRASLKHKFVVLENLFNEIGSLRFETSVVYYHLTQLNVS